MTRRIHRNDPAYEQAMREAKALFDAAMQKSAMKGRGRPAGAGAAAAAAAPALPAEAPATDAEIVREIGDDMPPEVKAIVGAADAPEAPQKAAAPKASTPKAAKTATAKPATSKTAAKAPKAEPAPAPAKKRVVRRPKAEG